MGEYTTSGLLALMLSLFSYSHSAASVCTTEYMEHGSLYDLLHNETMVIDGELLVPILQDISQGLRFLHSADPQVLHGDLKGRLTAHGFAMWHKV